MTEGLLPRDTRVLVLGSGMVGHEMNCLGVAEALGAKYRMRRVAPRAMFARLAPYGPVDPKDRPSNPASPLAPPYPDIAIASGRVAAPYLRALKKASPQTFTVFLQDPRAFRAKFDLIWTPEHDSAHGRNVIKTLTSPHPFSPSRLARDRIAPDPRLIVLSQPRAAVMLGGPSGGRDFSPAYVARLVAAVEAIARQGYTVMVTPSRRTPPEVTAAVRAALAHVAESFVWDGAGHNPYGAMLALADAILVTGDSVNMIGEAAATGAPVHVLELAGSEKIDRFITGLEKAGAVRRFKDRLEDFSYRKIDASGAIAGAIAERFETFRSRTRRREFALPEVENSGAENQAEL
jgi:mitochondrial fission protein ELM1